MPIDTSIYSNIKQPQSYSLGDIVGIAQGVQNLRTGKIAQQRQGVALEQEKSGLDARQAIGAVMTDPQYRDPDTGLFDLNKLAPAVYSADPQMYHAKEALAGAAQANNDTITVKKNALGLADTTRALIGTTVGALATDPNVTPDKVNEALDQLAQQAPDAKPSIDVFRRHVKAVADKNPAAVPAYLMQARSQVMPAATQQTAQTPSGVGFNTGQVSGLINTNPGAGPVGPVSGTMTQNVVPPTGAEQTGTDINGNPVRIVKNAQGVISLEPMNTSGGAAGAPGTAGGAPRPMFTFPPGESPQTKSALEGERQGALTSLSQAPILHATNKGVLDEIDKTIATGTPGPALQHIASTLGAAFGTPEQKASAYDLVGKYLERNALQAAQAMGPHTNAGLESSIKSNGSVAYNPTAIKKITKLNDALVSGVEAYQPGLEKAIQSSPNQIFAKRQFDQQWAQNFDPRVMQIANAVKAGDKKELADLTSGLSLKDKQELARKAQAIEMLSSQGHL